MKLIKWLLCKCGKHDYEDNIKITGERNENGLPVCVFQKCKRCKSIGNEVYCHISMKIDKKEKGES